MKVIGRKKVAFVAEDGFLKGQTIEGMNLYCSYPIEKNGDGMAVQKIYVSASKLETLSYIPNLGDEIVVYYNAYRKVEDIKQAL